MATTNGQSVKQRVREERNQRHRDARIEHVRQRASYEGIINEFQSDAVEIENRKVPGGARWTLYAVVLLIAAFVGWSYWAKVDMVVVGQGKLITTEDAVVVQSFSTAPIHSIDVRFGDRVKAGQLVATLDTTFSEADLTQLNARKNASQAVIARLKAELEGSEFELAGHENDRDWETQFYLFRERKKNVKAEVEKFEAEKTKLNDQIQDIYEEIKLNEERIPIFQKIFDTQTRLRKTGSASVVDFESAKLNLKSAELELTKSKNRIKEFKADLIVKDKEIASFLARMSAETSDDFAKHTQELTAVEQEISKASRMDELLELRVPTDSGHSEFVVFEVAELSVGSILEKGQPLFKLIPIDVPLEAEVDIAGKDVAKLRAMAAVPEDGDIPNGSKVKIKLSAFDYQDHGTLDGFVRAISEGVFEDQDSLTGAKVANYKTRIKILDTAQLDKVPEDFRLLPGMSTTAEIKVGRRRVIHYFLYPILRFLDEGLREP